MCIRDRIYVDFESAIYKIDTCASDPEKLFTIETHLYKPYRFTTYLISRVNDEVHKPECYRVESEEDLEKVPEKLFKELSGISKFIAHKFNYENQILIKLMEETEVSFSNADVCHICEKEFKYDEPDENKNRALYYSDSPNDDINKYKKVRDH